MVVTFETLPKAFTELYDKIANIERLLIEKDNIPTATPDQLLTIKQAAELLSLSTATIYGLVSRSEIPVSKKGKRLYFSKQELSDWVKAGRKKTVAETSAEADQFLSRPKSNQLQ